MENKLKVYFDNLCVVCSKEIQHYKKQKGAEAIDFVEICSPSFDAKKEGVDPYLVHKVMHVRRSDGSFATGVDAFIEIWKALPKYKKLAALANNSLIRALLDVGYVCFAKIRPYLPRYKDTTNCENSPYCETNKI